MSNGHWSNWRRANFRFFERKLHRLDVSLSLVDLGAGPLQFGELFKKFSYTGVDFERYPDVTVVADMTKTIPLGDASCDIITLSNTLEHIPYPLHLLKEARRLLRPGGTVIGTVPFLMQVHQAPYDFNRYTNFQLEKLLVDAGFTDVSVEPMGQLVDTYDSMERKFFDHADAGLLLKIVRAWRRVEMRIVRSLVKKPSTLKYTEGYGFTARA